MIQIPQDVYEAINDPHSGFDRMFFAFLRESKDTKEAFTKCQQRMRDYFPNWNHYSSAASYGVCRNKRYKDRRNK